MAADVTRRRTIEDELREAEAALRASEARTRAEEHRFAVELQRALLSAALPNRDDAPVAARYEARSSTLEVGGDWYDTIELPDGRVALTVGDVVGHGLTAAIAMGKLRIAIGALAPHATTPAHVLSHLDEFAAGHPDIDYATACYAVFDPATATLRPHPARHPTSRSTPNCRTEPPPERTEPTSGALIPARASC